MFRTLAWLSLPIALAVIAGLYWLSESRRLSGRLEFLEHRTRQLEADLAEALGQRDEINLVLTQRRAELDAAQDARAELPRQPAIPEGVRLALAAVNGQLAADGHDALRVFHAESIDGRALHQVEVVERQADCLRTNVYLAARATLTLNRATGQLVWRFFEGVRLADGERSALPPEGFALPLDAVDGPAWEARLGYLVTAEGQYPASASSAPARARFDPTVGAAWCARFERLLGRATTEVAMRIERLGTVEQAAFIEVLALGYDRSQTLAMAIEAARLTVIVNRAAGTVELKFEDGVMRRAQAETRIAPEGFVLLLPGVTPEEASRDLLGMVIER